MKVLALSSELRAWKQGPGQQGRAEEEDKAGATSPGETRALPAPARFYEGSTDGSAGGSYENYFYEGSGSGGGSGATAGAESRGKAETELSDLSTEKESNGEDEIVPVGEMSRIPKVQQLIKDFNGKELNGAEKESGADLGDEAMREMYGEAFELVPKWCRARA